MVMRNRHDGGQGSPGWWDDVPPKIRSRFSTPPPAEPEVLPLTPVLPRPSAAGRVRDFGQLALLFAAVAIGNLVFLLLALSFLNGGPPLPFAAPGR